MARCLIIGCGCRGRALAASLIAEGHAVRGTTRSEASLAPISAVGAEPVLADPDRVATLVETLDHVTAVCHLLGSATGPDEELAALHGSRLEMLLTKLVDTTARGLVYEGAGTVDARVLRGGADRVRAFGERSLADVAVIDADPADHRAWLEAARGAIASVL